MTRKLHLYINSLLFSAFLVLAFGLLPVNAQQDNTRINSEPLTMTVYPIPSDTKINVRFSNTLKEKVARVEIVNVIGKKLREQTIIDKTTTEVSFNNLGDMPQGIYMVIARDEFGKILQSTRLIINR